MTIMLPLQPQEEARLLALALAKGVSADTLVRQAVNRLLDEAPGPEAGLPSPASGAALVAAMAARAEQVMFKACRDSLDMLAWRHLIGTDTRSLALMALDARVSVNTLKYRIKRLRMFAMDALGEAAA